MEILTFIFVVIIFFNIQSIKKRLSSLEGHKTPPLPSNNVTLETVKFVGDSEAFPVEPQPEEVKAQVGPPPSASEPVRLEPPDLNVGHVPQYEPQEPTIVEKKVAEFFAWLKTDWLAKSGALILLIGIGWFVSYAFAEGWVGEQGRIALGLIFGAIMLVFGYVRMRKSSLQGGLFLILGSTTTLTTVWAARTLYDMFPPSVALGIMFLSVAFVSVVSVLNRHQSLAVLSLLLGLGAPLLTNSPEPSFGGLFSYLLVVILGTVWMVVKTEWKVLLLISLVGVFLYGVPFSIDVSREIAGLALLYAFIFAGVFTIVANRTLMRSGKPPTTIDLSIVGGVGLYLMTWINAAAPNHWESLLYVAWAVAFAGIGFVIFKLTKNVTTFLVYAAVSLTYIVLATVATFDGPALTIALTIEAAFLPALVYRISRKPNMLIGLSIFLLGPVLLSFSSLLSREWSSSVPLDHLAVLLVLGCALAGLGLYTFGKGQETESKDAESWGIGLITVGSLYFLALIWLVPHGFFSPDYDTGKLVSLVIYTVIGVTTYIIGHVKDQSKIRFAGGLIAGLVILRLLFVEVWEMQASTRIITFLLVGALLIGTAFIEKKNKE